MLTNHMKEQSVRYASLSILGTNFSGAYHDKWYTWKEDWLKTGRSVLRAIGKELEFDDLRVSINKGGIAVTGEVSLMGIWNNKDITPQGAHGIYINTAAPDWGFGSHFGVRAPALMWRTIKHMKDFSGGSNRWLSYYEFFEPDDLVAELKGMVGVPWL